MRHIAFPPIFLMATLWVVFCFSAGAQAIHPRTGSETRSADGQVTVRLVGKHQRYSAQAEGYDTDIHSPKSVNIHPDGKKYYVNSLEGGVTIAYDMATHEKLAVVSHRFSGQETRLWAPGSGLYKFTHYEPSNAFMGKPVESCFSHRGRYLWVPYYRRSFDINAQDPSAIAVIDTETDTIIRLFETGPLPKMIRTSHDGRTIAVSHWGNNTVGLMDISSDDPKEWHHRSMAVVDYVLPLNFSLTQPADRDNGSGYALRGTVFTPDDRYLLVGCMGGGGGIAVIDVQSGEYLGRVLGMMANVRHLVINGQYLYLSINGGGCIQRVNLDSLVKAAVQMKAEGRKTCNVKDWETCQVGKGARTMELSPSGNYAFVACNNASRLYVVDTRKMKEICRVEVDSYPVGLDISDDGSMVIVTSQGHSNQDGGNAVNIFEVEYAMPEVAPRKEEPASVDSQENDSTAVLSQPLSQNGKSAGNGLMPYVYGGGILLLLTGGVAYLTHRGQKA